MLDGKDKFLVDNSPRTEGGEDTNWLGYVLSVIVIGVVLWIFYPKIFPQAQHQENFEKEYDKAESFYDEAKALSLSMPLLSDSIVFVVADSLLATLVEFNHDWMTFVSKDMGYEKYNSQVERLNNKIDKVRLEYEVAKAFRGIKNMLKEEEIRKRQWIENKKKKLIV
jgi:hypothetical protein